MCIAIFGEGLKGSNIARLATTDSVESFEMKERAKRHKVDFSRLAIFHFCLQTDGFKSVIETTEKFSGKVRMDLMRYHPEDEDKQASQPLHLKQSH